MSAMRTTALILFVLFTIGNAKSQTFMEHGLLRAQATLAPGVMLSHNVSNIYVHGNLEYYLDRHTSIRGDGFYFISSLSDQKPFVHHHSWLAGGAYHFGKTTGEKSEGYRGHFDPYIGLSAGMAFTQSEITNVLILPGDHQSLKVNPLYSPCIGFNFYAQRIFHLFGEVRFVGGKHFPDYHQAVSLDELRFSFGLGWNLKTAGAFKRK